MKILPGLLLIHTYCCRTITVEDYMFTPELVKELKPAGMYNYSNGTSNPDKTQVLYKYKPILLRGKTEEIFQYNYV